MSELARRLRLLQREAGRRDETGVSAAFDPPRTHDAACEVVDGKAGDDPGHSAAMPDANLVIERYPARSESLRHRQRFDTPPRTVEEARAQLAALSSRVRTDVRPAARGPTASASPRARASHSASSAAPATVRGEVSNRPPHAPPSSTFGADVAHYLPPATTAASARAEASGFASSATPTVTVRGEVSNRPPELLRSDSASSHLSPLDTLRRLLGVRPSAPRPPRTFDRALPGTEVAPGVRLHQHLLPWPPTPGTLDLCAFDHGHVDPTRLHFFDTETTGLAGGTGTRAFMLGLGTWHDGVFRVRQLTLTTLGGETAMLELFASWLAPDALLVSYNGRSYDAPLLATRYRLARRRSPLPGVPHLDLLHPTRRRYRGVWENCRLATIERELLGIVRDDDLPGSEAPRAWREWLAGGSARDLRRVGEHNRQDLVSLAQLLLHLAEAPVLAAE